jgi:hypothetical protein
MSRKGEDSGKQREMRVAKVIRIKSDGEFTFVSFVPFC